MTVPTIINLLRVGNFPQQNLNITQLKECLCLKMEIFKMIITIKSGNKRGKDITINIVNIDIYAAFVIRRINRDKEELIETNKTKTTT